MNLDAVECECGTPHRFSRICLYVLLVVFAFSALSTAHAAPQDALWSPTSIPENVGSSFVLSPDGEYAYVGDARGALHRFSAVDGSGAISIDLGTMIQSTPAVAVDGTIYVGTVDGTLFAMTPELEIRWQREVVGEISTSPALMPDGVIYVGTSDGFIYGFNADGSQKWFKQIEGYVGASPAVGTDG